jgi:hypothetical protein
LVLLVISIGTVDDHEPQEVVDGVDEEADDEVAEVLAAENIVLVNGEHAEGEASQTEEAWSGEHAEHGQHELHVEHAKQDFSPWDLIVVFTHSELSGTWVFLGLSKDRSDELVELCLSFLFLRVVPVVTQLLRIILSFTLLGHIGLNVLNLLVEEAER